MLYIVCAVLYFVVVKGDETTIETEKKASHFVRRYDKIFDTTPFINPVKVFFQNIDNRMKKLGVNKTSEDKVYNLGPMLYDYPEIWWTTRSTDGKTFGTKRATTATEMNTSATETNTSTTEMNTSAKEMNTFATEITTKKETTNPIHKETTIETSLAPGILRTDRTQTLKPLIIKRPNAKPGQIFGKRVYYKKRRVTRSTPTNPTAKSVDYMFVVNRDDLKGDLSIDTEDQNMPVHLKSVDGSGLHVAVTSAFLLNKDVTWDQYDYVIINKERENNTNTNGEPDAYEYYDNISSNETNNGEKVVIKVMNPVGHDKVSDLLKKGDSVVLGPEATANLTKSVKKKLYDIFKLTTSTAKAIIKQIPRQNQFVYSQNVNPYYQQMQMNQNQNFNGQNFNRNPMQQNPNLMRYPMNRNAIYNPNQNVYRNQFQQNGNYMGNYQNKGNLFRGQYPPNANFNRNPYANFNRNPNANFNTNPYANFNRNPNSNFNRNPNANFNGIPNTYSNNPNFNRYPFYQNPSANIYRSPIKQNQNNNFNPIQYQNQNSFNPIQNPNNFIPLRNHNNIIQNQNQSPFSPDVPTTNLLTTELTATPSIANVNVTEKSTAVEYKPDPKDDFEAYLPAIPTTMPYKEMGLVSTKPTPTTTRIRTTTATEPKFTRPSDPPRFTIPVSTLSPYVHELIGLQSEIKAGYFSVAMVGLFDTIALKKEGLWWLFVKYERDFENLEKINSIRELGKPIYDAVQSLTKSLITMPKDYLQDKAKLLHHAMFTRKQTVTMDINSVIDYIDTMFNEEEGIKLLKVVENIKKYPNHTTSSASEIVRDFNNAVLHPINRYRNTKKLRVLLDSLNLLLINHEQGARRRHNSKNRKLIDERNKILEFKNKYMIGNSTENDTKNKGTVKFTTTPIKKMSKPGDQQRYKIKSNNNKTDDNTKAKDVTTTTAVKTTTEAKQTTRDEDVFSKKYKSKFHPSKKISLAKLLRLKIEHPKLYKKYFKRKKNSHHTKDNRQNKHTNRARKRHSRARHKLSKEDKLLLKYRIMELKYQKLLKKLNANNKDQGNKRKSIKGAQTFPPISTNIKKTTEEVKEIGTETETPPVTQFRVFSKRQKDSRKLNTKTTIQKWLPIKSLDEFVAYSINPINYYKTTEYPDVLSKKFKTFNKLVKPEQINKVLNIVNPFSSYSDEEGIIRLNIDEAMNPNKANVRRHNTDELMLNKINRYSSYSSEETLLKSKIYKVFNEFSESYSSEELDDDDKNELKNTVRKLLMRRSNVKPVNRASSYSDDEEIIRQRLNI